MLEYTKWRDWIHNCRAINSRTFIVHRLQRTNGFWMKQFFSSSLSVLFWFLVYSIHSIFLNLISFRRLCRRRSKRVCCLFRYFSTFSKWRSDMHNERGEAERERDGRRLHTLSICTSFVMPSPYVRRMRNQCTAQHRQHIYTSSHFNAQIDFSLRALQKDKSKQTDTHTLERKQKRKNRISKERTLVHPFRLSLFPVSFAYTYVSFAWGTNASKFIDRFRSDTHIQTPMSIRSCTLYAP